MPTTLSPLRYPGGKTSIYKYIRELVQINHVTTYIEPFAGGCGVAIALLLNKDVQKIIINDIDPSIYAFWFAVKYMPDLLIRKIANCKITMDEWHKQKDIQKNKKAAKPLELAFSTLFLNRTNRSGIIKGGVIGGKNQSGKDKLDCRFTKSTTINKIKKISVVSNQIEIANLDAEDFIDQFVLNEPNALIFFDPPYFKKGPGLYTNFYDTENHQSLASKIQTDLANKFWIVTYDHCQEIKKMYSSLRYLEYYLTYSAQRKTTGIEYMFFSNIINQGNYRKYLRLQAKRPLLT